MTSPYRPTSPFAANKPDDELVDVYADQAPPAVLRTLQRQHAMWILGIVGLGLVGLVLPDSPWYWAILRWGCGLAILGFGGVRAMQSNGIHREITRRNEIALREKRRTQNRVAREAVLEDLRDGLQEDNPVV